MRQCGHVGLTLSLGADHLLDKEVGIAAGPEIEFTPRSSSAFLQNSVVSGALELEGGTAELEPALNLGWGQRWLANGKGGNWVPTVGGLTEINLPLPTGFGAGLAGDSAKETLTVAERLEPSAMLWVTENGSLTGAVAEEMAVVEPAALLAVTLMRSRHPTSSSAGV